MKTKKYTISRWTEMGYKVVSRKASKKIHFFREIIMHMAKVSTGFSSGIRNL